MFELFQKVSEQTSKIVTSSYSTSFYSAIQLLHKDLRTPICNIYGFVRFADEIVDTFHEYNKAYLLEKFKQDTFESIQDGISLNPILNSFQQTVNDYNIDLKYIKAFFTSMEMDIEHSSHNANTYTEYIYGSAEVVGLMCLQVFCENDIALFEHLIPSARSLGAAFQKVNFLRDINADYSQLNRTYFPNIDFNHFTVEDKLNIEKEIKHDFEFAYSGIKQLPWKARFGVYVAYKYYLSLLHKIKQTQPKKIFEDRIRIPKYQKAYIVVRATVKNKLKMI